MVHDRKDDLEHALDYSALRAREAGCAGDAFVVILLVDADDDCAAELGPALLRRAGHLRGDLDVLVVLPVPEYEVWFVGGAESLASFFGDDARGAIPEHPEHTRSSKAWVQRHAGRYAETVDQPRMTSMLDIAQASRRCPSLARLVREIRRRLG